jgi:molybdopterin converting factor small subunit
MPFDVVYGSCRRCGFSAARLLKAFIYPNYSSGETTMIATVVDLHPTIKATASIELRAFMRLSDLFKERHWTNALQFDVDFGDKIETTGKELLAQLAIAAEDVDIIFVNGRVFRPSAAIIRPGDRVALVPPGAPVPF